ncbi:hypothetical protein Sta7437_1992 [Stanieria cyanosphaera PCC 7437]|uniref:Uncharacterized protein n=1 Tax=Stanieria cyanosphaera (strain ATCC 29371 / PCC 7437) TaxID=111780 RepID=K9XU01_STAC7|nr:hypothetical protein [Stanieria cyanosphaera]AFZ35544.1 hypothetical protein Sta7437_1992 [Stanieria cyanosphaera PCC 7437]
MWSNCLNKPKFEQEQNVSFLGGTGTIKSRHQEANMWTYTVEMSMGLEPDFGRVGAETTIVLDEREIHEVLTSNYY